MNIPFVAQFVIIERGSILRLCEVISPAGSCATRRAMSAVSEQRLPLRLLLLVLMLLIMILMMMMILMLLLMVGVRMTVSVSLGVRIRQRDQRCC